MNLYHTQSATTILPPSISVGWNVLTDPLIALLPHLATDGLFVLIDQTVHRLYAQTLLAPLYDVIPKTHVIRIEAKETTKNINSCLYIWDKLESLGAGRSSMLINIGGGVLTDMGGFAAAVYKRGIRTINIPTTLMGMVDAAIGGKTAIDRQSIKNEIGTFHHPQAVFVDPSFLSTLPDTHLLSGYAEVLKHALLINKRTWDMGLTINPIENLGSMRKPHDKDAHACTHASIALELIKESILFKNSIVACDPYEQGERRILNLGHTVGHAIESFALTQRSDSILSHGHAVLIGLIAELYISHRLLGLHSSYVSSLVSFARKYYSPYPLSRNEYNTILGYARHDKKNKRQTLNIIGLHDAGHYDLALEISDQDLKNSLDFYCETFGG